MVYRYYICRVPNQTGVSLLYMEGSRPEWCIATIYVGSQPDWCIATIYGGFPTRMVYRYYIWRVPDQNGVSLLYMEGSRPDWCIATIYGGFPTRMVYRYYIWRVPDQNGVSLLYMESSRPEWCIATIYHAWDTPFWLGTLHIFLAFLRWSEAWGTFWTWAGQSITALTAWRKEEWRKEAANISPSKVETNTCATSAALRVILRRLLRDGWKRM